MSSPRYCKEWRVKTAQTGKLRTAAGPVGACIRDWVAQGCTYSQIAHSAQCSRNTISHLARDMFPTVNRAIARRILACDPTGSTTSPYMPVDATGTRRRLQALIAIGHTVRRIAAAIGHAPSALSKIIQGRYPTVRGTTARAVATLYRKWSQQPRPNTRGRNRARADGWHGPMAWGSNIDDPNAKPDSSGQLGRQPQAA